MLKPFKLEFKRKQGTLYTSIKLHEDYKTFFFKNIIFARFPILSVKNLGSRKIMLLPEEDILMESLETAKKLYHLLKPISSSIIGLDIIGIEEKPKNSKPDIPICRFSSKEVQDESRQKIS